MLDVVSKGRFIEIVEQLTARERAPSLLIQLSDDAAAIALRPSTLLLVVLLAREGEDWKQLGARANDLLSAQRSDVLAGLAGDVLGILVLGGKSPTTIHRAPDGMQILQREVWWFALDPEGALVEHMAAPATADLAAAQRMMRSVLAQGTKQGAAVGPRASMSDLQTQAKKELAAEGLLRTRIAGDLPVASIAVIAACAGIYILQARWDATDWAPALVAMGALHGRRIEQGLPEGLLAAGLLHGGLPHLISNSLGLFNVGKPLEALLGRARLVVAFALTVLSGNVVTAIASPDAVAVGASGGVFGLFGVLLGLTYREELPTLTRQRVRISLWISLVINFGLSLLPGISLAAHAGGFVAGLLLGRSGLLASGVSLPWRPSSDETLERRSKGRFRGLAFLSVIAFILSLGAAFVHGHPWRADLGRKLEPITGTSRGIFLPSAATAMTTERLPRGWRQAFEIGSPVWATVSIKSEDGGESAARDEKLRSIELALEGRRPSLMFERIQVGGHMETVPSRVDLHGLPVLVRRTSEKNGARRATFLFKDNGHFVEVISKMAPGATYEYADAFEAIEPVPISSPPSRASP